MTQLSEISGDHVFLIPVAGQGTAGTADEFAGFNAPWNCTVTAVKWTPTAAITANGSNYFTLRVRNRTTGAGDTEIATRAYSATNSSAFTTEDATLSSTAANLNIAEGDHITVEKVNTGTGLAMPDGVVQVHVKVR